MLSGWIMGGTRFFASASTMASWSGGGTVVTVRFIKEAQTLGFTKR